MQESQEPGLTRQSLAHAPAAPVIFGTASSLHPGDQNGSPLLPDRSPSHEPSLGIALETCLMSAHLLVYNVFSPLCCPDITKLPFHSASRCLEGEYGGKVAHLISRASPCVRRRLPQTKPCITTALEIMEPHVDSSQVQAVFDHQLTFITSVW